MARHCREAQAESWRSDQKVAKNGETLEISLFKPTYIRGF